MEKSNFFKETFIVLLASIILALVISFNKNDLLLTAFISFFIVISANVLTKKIVGYMFETNIKIKFWSWYQYGFRKDSHFKVPLPMLWLPLFIGLFSKGTLWWLAILEFDVEPRTEKVSRRHGLYRFTQVTEWHMGIIASFAILTNILLGLIAYFIGFELFAKISFSYAFWSIIPLSSLDGTKILFSSRALWITTAVISLIFFAWALIL